MTSNSFDIIKTDLKKILKSKKITYATLAEELGASESGVKKMLNSDDLSFNRIAEILEIAGVDVIEFFAFIGERPPNEKKFTKEQEEFFTSHPDTYRFFSQLMAHELDWKELKKTHKLTQKSVDKYLFELDKIDVIELHPDQKIKSRFNKSGRLTFGVKLAKEVIDQKHQAFLDFAHIPNTKFKGLKQLAYGSIELSEETAKEFNAAARELVNEFMRRSERERILMGEENLRNIGLLFVITPTDGMPIEKIPNR